MQIIVKRRQLCKFYLNENQVKSLLKNCNNIGIFNRILLLKFIKKIALFGNELTLKLHRFIIWPNILQ